MREELARAAGVGIKVERLVIVVGVMVAELVQQRSRVRGVEASRTTRGWTRSCLKGSGFRFAALARLVITRTYLRNASRFGGIVCQRKETRRARSNRE